MNPETLDGLAAWVDGMSIDEIKVALAASMNSSSVRDPDTLARYLYARANGLA